MSSHWQWEQKIIQEHDEKKPFAPENGQPLIYKPGDWVVFTNEYGVEFLRKVLEIYRPDSTTALYALGYRYLLDKSAYWMPVPEHQLRKARKQNLEG